MFKTPPPSPTSLRKKQKIDSYDPWPNCVFQAMKEIIKTTRVPALSIVRIMACIEDLEKELNPNEPRTALLENIKSIKPYSLEDDLSNKNFEYPYGPHDLNIKLRDWIDQAFTGRDSLKATLQQGRSVLVERIEKLSKKSDSQISDNLKTI